MKVIIFGATGMVGQGALIECLASPAVDRVLAIVRRSTGRQHPKLAELIHRDFTDFTTIEPQLGGYDACFFCLGVSSLGLKEAAYPPLTYDFALAAARTFARLNPNMPFIYVSGAGTDTSESGKLAWARIKGKTENDILKLFRNGYAFRPAFIQPLNGIKAGTPWLRITYNLVGPLYPLLKRVIPKYVTTTVQVGRAMIHVAQSGAPKRILENADINSLSSV